MTEVKISHVDYYNDKRPVIAGIEAEIARATGRHYAIAWDLLDARSLGEVRRMLRDLETERLRYAGFRQSRVATGRAL